jgi:bifunctional non-homologous end joining protein LigD
VLAEACRIGLEGIVSKRHDLPHHPHRTKTWLTTNCLKRQDFVVGGFTGPQGSPEALGALGAMKPTAELWADLDALGEDEVTRNARKGRVGAG